MPDPTKLSLKLAGEVLAKIASYDPYFPKPNEAMLMAWAEHFVLQNHPTRDDLLEAVALFYASENQGVMGVKPLPGSISGLARQIKTDRMAREEYKPPPDKSADPELPAVGSAGSESITLAEWERRHGVKFPRLGNMFKGAE